MYDFTGYDGGGTDAYPLDGYGGVQDDGAAFVMDPNARWEPGEGLLQKWEMEQARQSRIDEYNKWSPQIMKFVQDYLETIFDSPELKKVMESNVIDPAAAERARAEDSRNGEHDAFYEKYGYEFDEDEFRFTWDYDKVFGVDEDGELIPPRQGFVEIGPSWADDQQPPEWREEDKGTVEIGPITVEEDETSESDSSGGAGGFYGSGGSEGSSGSGFGATWGGGGAGGGGNSPSVHIGPSWVSEETSEEVPD